MANGYRLLVMLISTVLAVVFGLLLACIMFGVAKFLLRVDRRGKPPRGDDRHRR